MKDNESKYSETIRKPGDDTEQDQIKIHRKASIAVILIVLFMVVVLSFLVYFTEMHFGKTAGTGVLIILAIIIAGYMYKDEIKRKLKRK